MTDASSIPTEPTAGQDPATVPSFRGLDALAQPTSTAPDSTVVRTLTLPEDVAPVTLLGTRDEVLRAIEKGFTDVDIHVRGTAVTVSGPAARVDTVVVLLSELIDVARTGTPLTADAVERAVGLLETSIRPTEVLTDATGAMDLLNQAGAADAEAIHAMLMTLLHSNWASVATTDQWCRALARGGPLPGGNLVSSAMAGRL